MQGPPIDAELLRQLLNRAATRREPQPDELTHLGGGAGVGPGEQGFEVLAGIERQVRVGRRYRPVEIARLADDAVDVAGESDAPAG
jgi:hypothetical protein